MRSSHTHDGIQRGERVIDDADFARRFYAGKEPFCLANAVPGKRFWSVDAESGWINEYVATGFGERSMDGTYNIVGAMLDGVFVYVSDDAIDGPVFCHTPEASGDSPTA